MTAMTVERFRREVEQRRGERRRGAPRYPDELVAFAVRHALAARASGRRLHAAAKELGLSSMTLSAWLRRSGAASPRRLREVVLSETTAVESSDARGLEVTTSSGHVVRGLSIADAAALLRALQ
jgi:DNA invertase Pin-like site-specific DNA recombinase